MSESALVSETALNGRRMEAQIRGASLPRPHCRECLAMLTVLIVEANRQFRELLKETLRTRFPSIDVEEAGNENDVALIMGRVRPDIILVDMRLPGAGGLELARRIKQRDRRVPIAILAGHDLLEYREAAAEYGADHFVHKGSSCWEQISEILEEAIRKRQSGTHIVASPPPDP